METKPDIIMPGETLKLAPSISSLLKVNNRRDTGWRIGGRYLVNSTGGEGQAFLLTRTSGWCSALITINDAGQKLKENKKIYCYKKLKPFTDHYD